MKKTRIMMAAFCVGLLALTGCSEDNSVPEQQEAAADYLIGKWNFSKLGQRIEMDGEVVFDNIADPGNATYEDRYTFNKDNTVYSYTHFPATEDREAATYENTYDYEKTGNQLIIKNVQNEVYTILVLDKNQLKLQDVLELNDESGHLKVTSVRTFDRQ